MSDTPVNLRETDATRLEVSEFAPDRFVGDRYRILSLLGRGGMGVVYRVEDLSSGKEFALKTIDSRLIGSSIARRFEQEARTARAIDHPNVVRIHDLGMIDNDTPFMVMDLIAGETLCDLLREKATVSVEEALPIFVQVCFGLAAAHARGVIHRDIKPGNIMLVEGALPGTEGSVRVLDFGIAKITQHEGGEIQALTRTGEIFGSPLYMSPEQCLGSKIDQRSDIYSLGCVLFEALTGTAPFIGENALATMMQHQDATAPKLQEASLGKEFPAALENVLAKMLAKEPEQRYSDIGQVAEDLCSIMTDGTARAARPVSRSDKKGAEPAGSTVSLPMLVGLLLATAALFGLVGFGLSMLWGNPDRNVSSATGHNDVDAEKSRSAVSEFMTVVSDGSELRNLLVSPVVNGEFTIRGMPLDRNALNVVAEKQGVKYLTLQYCVINNSDMPVLRKVGQQLRVFSCLGSNLDDVGAAEVAGWPNIRELCLDHSKVTDKGIAELTRLRQLDSLEIADTPVRRKGMAAIAQNKRISYLRASSMRYLKDADLEPLADSQLHRIILQDDEIGDDAMATLARMPALEWVSLDGTRVTEQGVRTLLKNKHLKEVTLSDCSNLGADQIKRLRSAAGAVKIQTKRPERQPF